jgi:8-oxo-dGTP pyrophosphatase MutT (NUDIX family)
VCEAVGVGTIRNIALGAPVREGHVLVSDGVDRTTGERFHRLLGGGIEFGEHSAQALRREFREELDVTLDAVDLLGVLEDVFTYEGATGHQIAHVYAVRSAALDALPLDAELVVLDEGSAVRWVRLDTTTPVWPAGVLGLLT